MGEEVIKNYDRRNEMKNFVMDLRDSYERALREGFADELEQKYSLMYALIMAKVERHPRRDLLVNYFNGGYTNAQLSKNYSVNNGTLRKMVSRLKMWLVNVVGFDGNWSHVKPEYLLEILSELEDTTVAMKIGEQMFALKSREDFEYVVLGMGANSEIHARIFRDKIWTKALKEDQVITLADAKQGLNLFGEELEN